MLAADPPVGGFAARAAQERGNLMGMNVHDDVARFRADDDERLVAASFACPVCLGLDADARLVLDPDDAEVACACSSCRTRWSVAVDAAQVMRLMLHPPVPRRAAPLRLVAPHTADAP